MRIAMHDKLIYLGTGGEEEVNRHNEFILQAVPKYRKAEANGWNSMTEMSSEKALADDVILPNLYC